MERQDSFVSLTDSELSFASVSTEDGASSLGRSRAGSSLDSELLRTPGGSGAKSSQKERLRRSGPKRQAPQPPSRPSPSTTPAPSSPTPPTQLITAAQVPISSNYDARAPTPLASVTQAAVSAAKVSAAPVTTVHMQLTPMAPPAGPTSAGNPSAVQQTHRLTKIVSHSVSPPLSSASENRPMSPPLLGGAAPPAPQRSGSSQAAARGLANLRIRLIDEESDSDANLAESGPDLGLSGATLSQQLFPAQRLVQAQSPRYDPSYAGDPTLQDVAQARHQGASFVPQHSPQEPAHPSRNAQYLPREVAQSGPPTQLHPPHPACHPQEQDENYDFSESFDSYDDSPTPPCVSPVPGEREPPTVVYRGRARRLMHSASDPGVSRPHNHRPYAHSQHPRAPGLAVPPPLDQLSEEEGCQEVLEGDLQEALAGQARLQRSDSMVTVAHLYEDVLVSSRLRIRVTLTNLTVVVVVAALVLPNSAAILYAAFRLVFGTLFPAYYSYKAVKTKNVKEYVKWMMYWIVFAFFTCFETLTDLFLSFWFPFYYELKILVVLWLLSPATRGSSILYRKFVHPWLTRREDDIDNCIAQAKQQGYSTVIQLGTKGVNYATTVLMQTAIKGGGGIVNQLRRSYSSGEFPDGDMNRNVKALPHIPDDDYDDHMHSSGSYESEPRIRAESDAAYRPRGSSASRGVRSTKTRSADVTDYYQDVAEEDVQRRRSPRTQDSASRVLSADDLTSGYSSGDPDAGDLIYDLRHNPAPVPSLEPTSELKRSAKVRRTQSLSASTLSLHRSQRAVTRRSEGRGAGRSGSAGRGSGPVDDLGAPASYSSSGHTAAPHHGSSFKRSRPGEGEEQLTTRDNLDSKCMRDVSPWLTCNNSKRDTFSSYALKSVALWDSSGWRNAGQGLSLRYTSKSRQQKDSSSEKEASLRIAQDQSQ
ncbi:uncharacterized protein LOC122263537 isoform X2 [Penaeus japonicus]|uniref:uncharacterized protein LOC122263537 isoform X2 n=1 Tax=Penaeus japonicus TaxID=27405 RepID=UPI001C70C687|nr:uncharacterized protein LOC122263537 isoform X2 [Penaeus japonicus]